MKSKMVRYKLSDLPEPTPEQMERLKRLSTRPESEIDYSDIPEMSDEQWAPAHRRRLGETEPQAA